MIEQADVVQLPHACGGRCVEALLARAGVVSSWHEVLTQTGWTATRGTTFAGLRTAFVRAGLRAEGWHTTIGGLQTMLATAVGAVVQLQGEHFVAVLGVSPDGFEVVNPQKGGATSRWSFDLMEGRWTGHALVVRRAARRAPRGRIQEHLDHERADGES